MTKSPAHPPCPHNKHLFVVRFLLACLIAVIAVSSGAGSDAVAQKSTKGDALNSSQKLSAGKARQFVASNWGVNCKPQTGSKKLACVLSQSIVIAKSRKVFLTVSIHPSTAKTATAPYMVTVRLPHGLALESGIQLQIDEQKPGRLTLYTSGPQAVFARIGVADKLLSSLKNGNQLRIIFKGRNGRKFIMSMSLKSFTAGFEKLK